MAAKFGIYSNEMKAESQQQKLNSQEQQEL
jgi:hypothetical protein